MTSPPPNPLTRAAALSPWTRQGRLLLGRLLRRSSAAGTAGSQPNGGDPFLESARRLRQARESHGLSLRQLANETRISITVLESLEKGWRERLPEAAYLRPMLSLLEQHLDLERGSLQLALPPRKLGSSSKAKGERVSLTSIELFASWQGSLLYALLCLLLIYGLNRQQQRLVAQGLLPLRTVAAQPASAGQALNATERARARVLAAYPDLRPLERARRGQGLTLLRVQDAAKPAPSASSAPASASQPADRPAAAGSGAGADGQGAAGSAPRP